MVCPSVVGWRDFRRRSQCCPMLSAHSRKTLHRAKSQPCPFVTPVTSLPRILRTTLSPIAPLAGVAVGSGLAMRCTVGSDRSAKATNGALPGRLTRPSSHFSGPRERRRALSPSRPVKAGQDFFRGVKKPTCRPRSTRSPPARFFRSSAAFWHPPDRHLFCQLITQFLLVRRHPPHVI